MSQWPLLLFAISVQNIHSADKNVSSEKPINRTITVAFSERKPFVILDRIGTPQGLDVSIIENFAKKFNLKINYRVINSSLNYIFAHEQNLNEFSTEFDQKYADIYMGGLGENILTKPHFIASRSYYNDKLTWCVQEKRPIPAWKNVFFLCNDPVVYIGVTILFVSAIVTVYFLQQFETQKWNWNQITCEVFALAFYSPTTYRPQTLPSRIFFVVGNLGCLILSTTLLAIIISFLINTIHQPQVKTKQEIIHGSFGLVGDEFAFEHLIGQHIEYPDATLEKFRVCDNLDQCLSKLKSNPRLAVAISREHVQHTRLDLSSYIYCFEKSQIIYEYATKFLIYKDFRFTKELNEFIRMASAGGLIEKWRSEGRNRVSYKQNEKIFKQFSITHFYVVLLFGYFTPNMIAIFVFMIEKIVYKKTSVLKPSRFWLFVKVIIDPDRHFLKETKPFSKAF